MGWGECTEAGGAGLLGGEGEEILGNRLFVWGEDRGRGRGCRGAHARRPQGCGAPRRRGGGGGPTRRAAPGEARGGQRAGAGDG